MYHVYCTPACVSRLKLATHSGPGGPEGADFGISYDEDGVSQATGPFGFLTFHRSIVLPQVAKAFRARVDHENTSMERAVLALAGQSCVYIYDLEDPEQMETFPYNLQASIKVCTI